MYFGAASSPTTLPSGPAMVARSKLANPARTPGPGYAARVPSQNVPKGQRRLSSTRDAETPDAAALRHLFQECNLSDRSFIPVSQTPASFPSSRSHRLERLLRHRASETVHDFVDARPATQLLHVSDPAMNIKIARERAADHLPRRDQAHPKIVRD